MEKIGSLHFEKPDMDKFPCIRLAYEALEKGGSSPIILNVANDNVVSAFLKGLVPFTQIPILTMPGDDITHPIPDLTGYITEGQIVVSRELHRKGIYPPNFVLPSLSRLMNAGIGDKKTREDHKQVSDQLYAGYAEGNDLRGLVAIVGKEALSERDQKLLEFADEFESLFVTQGREENRTIEDTLEIGWGMLSKLPESALTRIDRKTLEKYHPAYRKNK